MNEKYTIGDLAKEAGISTKAIRIYEKKGLIKPKAYSESRYRLYDNNAIFVLQKIMTLKFVGFSLAEIGALLEQDKENDILKSLSFQRQLLEVKRAKIEKVIHCVDQAYKRCAGGEIDWNSFTDIMRAEIIERNADEGYITAVKYGINKNWYVDIYRNINIKTHERILDIGCSFGLLWRNNWNNIPPNTDITLMDLHGTWADDFEKFVGENIHLLQEGTHFEFVWDDVENEGSIVGNYHRIIANYLFAFIKEPVKLMQRIKKALAEDGIFFSIYAGNSNALETTAALLRDFVSNLDTLNDRINHTKQKHKEFYEQLCSVFQSVDWTTLKSGYAFDNTNDFFDYVLKKELVTAGDLNKRKNELEYSLSKIIEKEGKIIIPNGARLYRCR